MLRAIQDEGHNWGWGVGEDMGELMSKDGFSEVL
jgi:hypothetical protein